MMLNTLSALSDKHISFKSLIHYSGSPWEETLKFLTGNRIAGSIFADNETPSQNVNKIKK